MSLAFFAHASEAKATEPTAKPVFTLFSNYNYDFSDEVGGFDIERAYLGYKFKFNEEFSAQVVFDVGSTGIDGASLDLVAYLKAASLTWHKGGLDVNFGMIKTQNFSFQEKIWGYRYLAKSYLDKYSFASSADIGISASYDICDKLSVEAQFINGEGYKKVQLNNNYRYGIGATLQPFEGFYLRAYYDYYSAIPGTANEDDDTQIISAFAAYKNKLFSVGLEYNYIMNDDFIKDLNYSGISSYLTVRASDKFKLFARYDYTTSTSLFASAKKVGSTTIGGLEYSPNKYIKISPNVQSFRPEGSSECETYLFLSLYVNF